MSKHQNSENCIPKMLTTAQVAAALHRTKQTVRLWACCGNGPLKPVRINGFGGPLLWRESDVISVLNGQSDEQDE